MNVLFDPPDIELLTVDLPNLRRLAASEPADLQAPAGALPPAHVAARALAQLASGVPAPWCVPMLILSATSGEILGGCTFKGAPVDGRVEIGYGVAETARRRGVATAAVSRLLRLAAASGLVTRVDAHILPDNLASSLVVSRLGFSRGEMLEDPPGEWVVRWSHAVP